MYLHRLFVKDDSHHTSLELHSWFDSPFRRYAGNPIWIQPYPPVNLFSHRRRSWVSFTGSCLCSRMCTNLFQCVCSLALLRSHQTLDPFQVTACTSLHQATRTNMCALSDSFTCMQYQSVNFMHLACYVSTFYMKSCAYNFYEHNLLFYIIILKICMMYLYP